MGLSFCDHKMHLPRDQSIQPEGDREMEDMVLDHFIEEIN